MTLETLADRIQRIRARLREIEAERANMEEDNFDRSAELLDEERTLEARLAELKDEAAEEGVGIAEREAGEMSDYERVPDLPDHEDR